MTFSASTIHFSLFLSTFAPDYLHASFPGIFNCVCMGGENHTDASERVPSQPSSLYPRGGPQRAQQRTNARLPSLVSTGRGKSHVAYSNLPHGLFVFDGPLLDTVLFHFSNETFRPARTLFNWRYFYLQMVLCYRPVPETH